MRKRTINLFARMGLFAMIWASLSGCFLHNALGNVTVASSVGEGVDDFLAFFETHATGGTCHSSSAPPHNEIVSCWYFIDGVPISSTVDLISELGILGVLIDPLILEVPSDVISVTATYDSGNGPQPMPVGRADSFLVHPGLRITAEVGTTFLLLDLPGDVEANLPADPGQGTDLDFSLSFNWLVPHSLHPPLTIKPMVAGLVTAQHQRYYIPLLPCVTGFADVPAVTIPEADTPQHLEMTLGDLIRNHDAGPCDHAVHDFSAATPPPGLVFAPLVRR